VSSKFSAVHSTKSGKNSLWRDPGSAQQNSGTLEFEESCALLPVLMCLVTYVSYVTFEMLL